MTSTEKATEVDVFRLKIRINLGPDQRLVRIGQILQDIDVIVQLDARLRTAAAADGLMDYLKGVATGKTETTELLSGLSWAQLDEIGDPPHGFKLLIVVIPRGKTRRWIAEEITRDPGQMDGLRRLIEEGFIPEFSLGRVELETVAYRNPLDVQWILGLGAFAGALAQLGRKNSVTLLQVFFGTGPLERAQAEKIRSEIRTTELGVEHSHGRTKTIFPKQAAAASAKADVGRTLGRALGKELPFELSDAESEALIDLSSLEYLDPDEPSDQDAVAGE